MSIPEVPDFLPRTGHLELSQLVVLFQALNEPTNQFLRDNADRQLKELQKSNALMYRLVGDNEIEGQLPQMIRQMGEMQTTLVDLGERVVTLETQREGDVIATAAMHEDNKQQRTADHESLVAIVQTSQEALRADIRANRAEIYRNRRTAVRTAKRSKRFMDSFRRVGAAFVAFGQDDSPFSAKKIVASVTGVGVAMVAIGGLLAAAVKMVPEIIHKAAGLLRAIRG